MGKMRSLVLIILMGLQLRAALRSQDPVAVLKGYEEAHNDHDIIAALSYLVDDVQFELVDVWTKKGIQDMRALAEWDARLNSNLDFHIQEIRGDSIFCSAIEKNDWFRAIGMEMFEHDWLIFIIKNGLIHKIIAYPSPEDSAAINLFIGEISRWTSISGITTLKELLPDGQFVYSEAAATRWLELIDQWKKR